MAGSAEPRPAEPPSRPAFSRPRRSTVLLSICGEPRSDRCNQSAHRHQYQDARHPSSAATSRPSSLYYGVLPHKLKEMCRIKISVAHQCGYCSTVRSHVAKAEGLTEDMVTHLSVGRKLASSIPIWGTFRRASARLRPSRRPDGDRAPRKGEGGISRALFRLVMFRLVMQSAMIDLAFVHCTIL
jgi:AhpD family alkylhydroperoxidase